MLGVLCARPRPWLLTSLSLSYAHGSVAAPFNRLIRNPPYPVLVDGNPVKSNVAASIWHAILPYGWRQWRRRAAVFSRRDHEGEGSWNVAWDARPARWLHHPDSAWLLFGLTLAPIIDSKPDLNSDVLSVSSDEFQTDATVGSSDNYRITGVTADGRCLFRAIAHMACLRNGEKAPDENRQRELADELRAQVVEELLKRRKDVEWFIEEDFDVYVKMIQQPYVWGGEPELIMSSHVLSYAAQSLVILGFVEISLLRLEEKLHATIGTPISVFMKETTSGSLIKIANYGEEYDKNEEEHINVLFHGYGHYDILETIPDSRKKVNA